MNVWSDEAVATLKRLHLEGYSFSEIATNIGGVSRNACIGKAHRLGILDTDRPVHLRNGAMAGKVTKERVRPRPGRPGYAGYYPPKPRPPVPAFEPAPTVLFIERHDFQCGFIPDSQDHIPIHQRKCCGAEVVPDQPFRFCAYHHARFTIPLRRRAA